MTKLDWNKAKNSRASDPAHPGGKPRRKTVIANTWDELEQAAFGDQVIMPDKKRYRGPPLRRVNEAEIEAAKTPKGAWTRATLASWGVPWPPPKGWKAALIAGVSISEGAKLAAPPASRESVKDSLEAKLLHDVVMALTNSGKAYLLADLPEVLDYFGGRMPTVSDIIGGRQDTALITGGITLDDMVWSFSCVRTAQLTR